MFRVVEWDNMPISVSYRREYMNQYSAGLCRPFSIQYWSVGQLSSSYYEVRNKKYIVAIAPNTSPVLTGSWVVKTRKQTSSHFLCLFYCLWYIFVRVIIMMLEVGVMIYLLTFKMLKICLFGGLPLRNRTGYVFCIIYFFVASASNAIGKLFFLVCLIFDLQNWVWTEENCIKWVL